MIASIALRRGLARWSKHWVLLASTCLTPLASPVWADDFGLDEPAADGSASADSSKEKPESEKPVTVNEAGMAIGYQQGSSGMYGRFSGSDKAGMVSKGWVHLEDRTVKKDDGTFFVTFDARNIDLGSHELLEDGEARLKMGQQGTWTARLNYQGTPYIETDNYHTLFRSDGSLQNGLAAKSINTTSTNAAGIARASQYLAVEQVGTRRDRVDGSFSYKGIANWTFTTKIDHEHKQGTKSNSFMFINNNYFAAFLEPVQYDTDRITATAAYTRKLFQAQLSYVFSSFTNTQQQWVGSNPFIGTTRSDYTGSQYSLPPSNTEHMLKGEAGLNVGTYGRLNLNTRVSAQIQNESYTARYYEAGTSRVDGTHYDGLIQNHFANLVYSDRLANDWTVKAAYTVDHRDNNSPSYTLSPSYRGDTGTATWNGSGGIKTVTPYSFLNQSAELESGYRLTKDTRLSGTFTHTDKQREYSVTNRNTEDRGELKVRSTFGKDVSADFSVGRAFRDAQDYNGNLAWNYVGRTTTAERELSHYNYTDRLQDQVKGSVTWAIQPELSLTGSVSYTDNNYPDVVYGVTKDHFLVSSIDVGYTPVSGINTHLFYSYQEVGSALEINSSSANTGVDWKLQTSDDIHTVGTGVEWQLNPKLKLSLDDSLSFARTTYGITSRQRNTASPTATNTGTDLPDTLTIQNSLRLSGEYEVEDGITLGLTGQWEHLMSKDYLNVQEAASTSNTTSQTVLISGTGDPSYDVGVLMATAKVKW